MGKFNTSSVQSAQLDNLQELANIQLPTGETAPAPQPQQQTAPAQEGGSLMGDVEADLLAQQSQDVAAAELAGEVGVGIEAGLAEEQRHAIPSVRERATQEKQGTLPIDTWAPRKVSSQSDSDTEKADGGLMDRARTMAQNVTSGAVYPAIYNKGWDKGESTPSSEVAADIREGGKTDSLVAALHSSEAVTFNEDLGRQVPNPQFIALGSILTEDYFADASFGDSDIEAELEFGRLEGKSDEEVFSKAAKDKADNIKTPLAVAKSKQNTALGQKVHQEWQRNNGVEPTKLPKEEATVVGDMFKEMWYQNNKDAGLMSRAEATNGQVYFQLTPKGADFIEKGGQQRKVFLPKKQVRPSKVPLPGGKLKGDVGENVARTSSGNVGDTQYAGTAIDKATKNLATVPNVVNKQRAKILLSTLLPVLAAGPESYEQDDWRATINNVGQKKYNSFVSKDEKMAGKNMNQLRNKVAQEVRAIAQERNGANFLTYYIQAYNGRIAPNQTAFDPTSSKAVRFVTTNAAPSIADPNKSGNRINRNLRQMYAMMLVPGADKALPDVRERMLIQASPQMEAWGMRLADSLTMTDEQYEAISDAIVEGKPLSDPAFGGFTGLQLDAEADKDLIASIKGKGEDGPHYIDGLIDFAKYQAAKRAGTKHPSYFNAYMDGKTNGIASNGIQMGDETTALRTGVIRTQNHQLLDGDIDIRDELQATVLNDVTTSGFDHADPDVNIALTDIADTVFRIRDLHKATTMTFGYGKDIANFNGDIEKFMGEEYQDAKNFLKQDKSGLKEEKDLQKYERYGRFVSALDNLQQKMQPEEISEALLNVYGPAIEASLSTEAVQSRGLMRSTALINSLMDKLMTLKSPVGSNINLGRPETLGAEGAKLSQYTLKGDEETKHSTYQYETHDTSAAVRGDNPGGYAYGGSVPAPVQAMDASTVAQTASGRSWSRLKDASGGNPYLHTIYDAFKVDAMGYDVVLEEVNENWLKTAMNWSYLEETKKGLDSNYEEFRNELKSRDLLTPLTNSQSTYIKWLFGMTPNTNGDLKPQALVRQLGGVMNFDVKDKKEAYQARLAMAHKILAQLTFDPTGNLTLGNMKEAVELMLKETNIRSRLTEAATRTNKRKQALAGKIRAQGHKLPNGKRIALQYYAH